MHERIERTVKLPQLAQFGINEEIRFLAKTLTSALAGREMNFRKSTVISRASAAVSLSVLRSHLISCNNPAKGGRQSPAIFFYPFFPESDDSRMTFSLKDTAHVALRTICLTFSRQQKHNSAAKPYREVDDIRADLRRNTRE